MEFINLEKLIYDTPLLKIKVTYEKEEKTIFAKLESKNLSGSIKDRPCYHILKDALQSGKIKKGDDIVEVSSGNMGISLATFSNILGLKANIILPRFASQERKNILNLLGANVIEVDNFKVAKLEKEKYLKRGYFSLNQFSNINNLKSHSKTANEILPLIENENVECILNGVGTGGTLLGLQKYLQRKLPYLKTIALEPYRSRILSKGKSSPHKIEGIGDEFIPDLYNEKVIDGFVYVKDEEAINATKSFILQTGIQIGISSGANLIGALKCPFRRVLTVFSDGMDRYFSVLQKNEEKTPNFEVKSIEVL